VPRTPATRHVFHPVQLVRPAEVVAHRIAEAIRAGDVKVGERLPSEQNLSTQLNISRPTLREALKLLSAAAVLEVRPGSSGGIFVVSQSVPTELGGQPLPEMPMEDLAVVMEARRLIEPQVARMAAAFGTPADFQAMHEAVALSEEAARPFRRRRITQEGMQLMTLASTRFNIAMARATQNAMMVQIMELLLRRMEPVRLRALAELDDVAVSTRTLADSLVAIESGDPDSIERATFARIALLEQSWERATGKRLRRRPLLRLVAEGIGMLPALAAAAPAPNARAAASPRRGDGSNPPRKKNR
jgi:GntR family transcriptional regulator, transcriptional repressor for pyruvate dehydrogenase complex